MTSTRISLPILVLSALVLSLGMFLVNPARAGVVYEVEVKDHAKSGPYSVVVNHEEQYSIVPTGKPLAAGYKATGFTGTKAECRKQVKVWTDMRPKKPVKGVTQREEIGVK